MTTSVTFSGVDFAPSDFNNYGWKELITVNGTSYIRVLGLFAAAMSDLGKALTVSATGSIDFDTLGSSDTGSITLAQNRPYRENAYVIITGDGDTSNWFLALVTADVTATTLNYEVVYVNDAAAGGTETSFTVQISGPQGEQGATGVGWEIDTAANFAGLSPTVDDTVYLEEDTGRVKIGDGSTGYDDLPYVDELQGPNLYDAPVSVVSPDTSGVMELDVTNVGTVFEVSPATDDTFNFTNVNTSRVTFVIVRVQKSSGRTFTAQVNSSAANSFNLEGDFDWSSTGYDEVTAIIDEAQNVTFVKFRTEVI